MKKNDSVFLKIPLAIVLAFSLTFNFTACDNSHSTDFPNISYHKTDSDTISTTTSEENSGISSGTIRIALPFSSECVRYLTCLYIGESAGLFKNSHSTESGLNVSIDTLDSYNVGLNTVLQMTGSRGLSDDEIITLSLSNNLPDIFLMNNLQTLNNKKVNIADLNSAYTDNYLTPKNIYPSMIVDSVTNPALYTVPLYASVKMIYANRTLIDRNNLDNSSTLKSPLSLQTIQALSKKITNVKDGVYGFMGFESLLAFLPCATNPFPQSYLWNKNSFDFHNSAFINTVDLLQKFAAEKTSVDSITSTEKLLQYGSNDPRSLNKIAFWVDDSDSISSWSEYATVERYPLPVIDRVSVPLKVYSIAVNGKSLVLKDAIRLAVYMALDSDALLFRSRYNINEGFIPPLSSQDVWNHLVAVQKQGNELMLLREVMENSDSVSSNSSVKISDIYNTLYSEYFKDILFNNVPLDEKMSAIDARATELLIGG